MSEKDAATPRVYLIRHGETEWSRNGRYTGISDLPLLPEGESRVRQTASVVVGKGRLIDTAKLLKIYCSPRQRATRTLELLLEQGGTSQAKIDTSITEEIAEWHYADYEGLKTHEIIELRKSRGHDKERKWNIWRDGTEGEDCESPDQVATRLDRVIASITEQHSRYLQDIENGKVGEWNGKRDMLVIAHGHILRAFVKRWLGVPMETSLELMLEPGGVCGLSYAHGKIEERAVLCGFDNLMSIANQALADELEAVNSIYKDDTLIISGVDPTSSHTNTILSLPDQPFSFSISFPLEYPDVPPSVVGSQSTGAFTKKGEGEAASNVLRDVLGRIFTPGQVCLFDLIEETVPLLQTNTKVPSVNLEGRIDDDANQDITEDTSKRSAINPINTLEIQHLTSTTSTAAATISPPDWILSEQLVVSKSRFIARALKVSSLSQATDSISHLLATDKKVAGATHNITAWRIKQKQTTTTSSTDAPEVIIQDCDDDGETAAGSRLLHLMQVMDVWNVAVIVTRWYGGVKLGPDRFRIINSVAREALVNGGFAKDEDVKSKSKGKKR